VNIFSYYFHSGSREAEEDAGETRKTSRERGREDKEGGREEAEDGMYKAHAILQWLNSIFRAGGEEKER
jgi:hypothetical protein